MCGGRTNTGIRPSVGVPVGRTDEGCTGGVAVRTVRTRWCEADLRGGIRST